MADTRYWARDLDGDWDDVFTYKNLDQLRNDAYDWLLYSPLGEDAGEEFVRVFVEKATFKELARQLESKARIRVSDRAL